MRGGRVRPRRRPGYRDAAGCGEDDAVRNGPHERTASMKIDRLDHLVLTVADIDRTCQFYTQVLGMEVVKFGEGRTAVKFGRQKINLHPADNIPGLVADQPTLGSGDLCFITDLPLAEVAAHLEKCGVTIVAGPGLRAGAIGTIQSVYIRDPDLNLIEISNY
jgi:catechol 2,3-dioxygenase-like lactoylglutathione lyase family enzyme